MLPKYKRILLKLSGEALSSKTADPFDPIIIEQYAIEIKAEVILKGTRVDGIYTSDPEKDPSAVKFEKISFQECLTRNLKVMDMTAFTLCMENNLPIIVFDMNKPGNLLKVVEGMNV